MPKDEGTIGENEVKDLAYGAQSEVGRNIVNGVYYRVPLPDLELDHTQRSDNGFISSVT